MIEHKGEVESYRRTGNHSPGLPEPVLQPAVTPQRRVYLVKYPQFSSPAQLFLGKVFSQDKLQFMADSVSAYGTQHCQVPEKQLFSSYLKLKGKSLLIPNGPEHTSSIIDEAFRVKNTY